MRDYLMTRNLDEPFYRTPPLGAVQQAADAARTYHRQVCGDSGQHAGAGASAPLRRGTPDPLSTHNPGSIAASSLGSATTSFEPTRY